MRSTHEDSSHPTQQTAHSISFPNPRHEQLARHRNPTSNCRLAETPPSPRRPTQYYWWSTPSLARPSLPATTTTTRSPATPRLRHSPNVAYVKAVPVRTNTQSPRSSRSSGRKGTNPNNSQGKESGQKASERVAQLDGRNNLSRHTAPKYTRSDRRPAPCEVTTRRDNANERRPKTQCHAPTFPAHRTAPRLL